MNQNYNQQINQLEQTIQQLMNQTQQASQMYQQMLQQEQQNVGRLEELAQREQKAVQTIQQALHGHQIAMQQMQQMSQICKQIEQNTSTFPNQGVFQPQHHLNSSQPSFGSNPSAFPSSQQGGGFNRFQ